MKAKTTTKRLGLFATGALVGGAVAVLATPKDGRAMRKAIRKEVKHQSESAARLARSVAGGCQSAYDSSRTAAGKLVSWTRRLSA